MSHIGNQVHMWLSVRQAAELIGVSPDIIRAHIASGALTATDVASSRGKARWRIACEDLNAFLIARRNIPPAPKNGRGRRAEKYQPRYY